MKKSLLLTFALLAAACWSQSPKSDSRSNWLRECTSARNCGSALSCVCGVCTEPCEAQAACADDEREAVCLDPATDGVGSECARAEIEGALGICLLACDEDDDCEQDQRCAQGACLPASLVDDDAGQSQPGPLDAGAAGAGGTGTGGAGTGGTTTPGGGGAGTGPVSPGSNPDAGTSVDRPDASLPPACDDSLRPCCSSVSSCPDELVCHVDNTCIAAASPDENGVATIEPLFPSTDELVAIDAQHAYGLRHQGDRVNGRSQLVRWPLAGGGAEVLADGASFYPGTFPIRVDAERLYFVAKDSEEAISFSLYSLPKDGSAAPAPHGTAGLRLVDDAEHVYFSNDGDSRVARLAKATLGTAAPREPVYTSVTDAPGTILSLAINSTHVMVVEQQRELSPMSYTVRRVDKISLVANILGDETKFTIALRDGDGALPTTLPTLANDTHLALLGADGYVDLLDLVTFEVKPLPRDRQMTLGSISGDDFYYGWFGNGPGGLDRGVDRLALRTGLRTELLAPVGVTFRSFTSGGYGSMVASPDGLWIVTGGDDGEPPRLLRIARSP